MFNAAAKSFVRVVVNVTRPSVGSADRSTKTANNVGGLKRITSRRFEVEVLAKFLVSPEYAAVMKLSPEAWLTLDVVRVAIPLLSVPVPSDVDPLKNSTVPVGLLPLTSAVNSTD
jgi:hypothetical protein